MLDRLSGLIDGSLLDRNLVNIYAAAKGELAWPSLALFRALLLTVWYDLSDRRLAEALEDRYSLRRFSLHEATPERTAFVRLRRELVPRGLDKILFDEVTRQLKAQAVKVKTGTLVDATVTSSASIRDEEAAWAGHKRRKATHGFKAHVAADAETALVEDLVVTPGNVHDGRTGDHIQHLRCRIEKVFVIWKRSYRLRRMRCLGLGKAALQVRLTAMAYNLKRTAVNLMIPEVA